jgi:hypothetical protein
MNPVSPLLDASASGSLANASLCEAPANVPPPSPGFVAAAEGSCAASPAPAKSKWRRLVDAMLSPISGPRMPPRG